MSYKSSARSILATSLASLPSLDSAVLAFAQYLFKQGNLKGFDYSHNADSYQLTLKILTLRSFKKMKIITCLWFITFQIEN